MCAFECVQVKLEKALMCLRALSWHMCVHRSVDSCKTVGCVCVGTCFCVPFMPFVFLCVHVCSDALWWPLASAGDCSTEREADNKLKI